MLTEEIKKLLEKSDGKQSLIRLAEEIDELKERVEKIILNNVNKKT